MKPTSLQDRDIEPFSCPHCREHIDAAFAEARRGPQLGDIGLCMYCSQFFTFRKAGDVRRCTTEEELEARRELHKTMLRDAQYKACQN